MKVKYNDESYNTIKEAFDEFLIDINSDDTEFLNLKEAYKYFKNNEIEVLK